MIPRYGKQPGRELRIAAEGIQIAVGFEENILRQIRRRFAVARKPQAPPQPIQGCPGSGVAVSVTAVPLAKLVATGFVVTVPLPFLLMLILKLVTAPPPPPVPPPPPPPPVAAAAAKFACTLFSPLML